MSSNVVSLEVEVMYGSDIGDTQMHYGLLKKICILLASSPALPDSKPGPIGRGLVFLVVQTFRSFRSLILLGK